MASIQGIYLALFNRPADPDGLAFWTEHTKGGTDLSFLVGRLTAAPEYLSRFADMDNEEIINSIYQSLFGRDAEPKGLAFFLEQLETGAATIETIAIKILDGAAGVDAAQIAAKIAAADLFTTHLDLDIEVEAYRGEEAAQIGRDYIEAVSADDPATPAEADAAILRLFDPDEGQNPGGGNGGGGGSKPRPTGDTEYGDADLVVLNGRTPIGSFSFEGYETPDLAWQAAETLGYETEGSQTLLVQSTTMPDESYYGRALHDYANSLSWAFGEDGPQWQGDTAFFNGAPFDEVFGPASITGTKGNDFVYVDQSNAYHHTVTGGRGNDLLVVYTGNEELPLHEAPDSEAAEKRELGSIRIDGGADDDIIIAGGGNDNVLLGGAGNDHIASFYYVRDNINGGAGDDVLLGGGDDGVAYDEAYFLVGEGVTGQRVNVDEISGEETSLVLSGNEANGTQLTFLGRLPDGSGIFRIDNDGEATSFTLNQYSDGEGSGFTKDIDIPAGGVVLINVGPANGTFALWSGGSAVDGANTGDQALNLLSDVDFSAGDVLTGGAGADDFVYEAGGWVNALDDTYWSVNGADTITDFKTGQDKIVLYAYGYRALDSEAGDETDLFYAEEAGFTDFAHAALAAEAADARFFFVANVDGDGYLFVDEYHDGGIDFAIRLEDLRGLGQFGAHDIEVRSNGPALVGVLPEFGDTLAA